jgi:hypothetical protein
VDLEWVVPTDCEEQDISMYPQKIRTEALIIIAAVKVNL